MQTSKIQALRARCLLAARRGYHIARARDYISSLEAMVGPVTLPAGVTAGSAAHLRLLCDAALGEGVQMDSAPRGQTQQVMLLDEVQLPTAESVEVETTEAAVEAPEPVAEPAEAAPVEAAVETAPEAPVEVAPVLEAPAEEVPLAVVVETLPEAVVVQEALAVETQPLSFEAWTMDELMAEAKARNLKGRNKMSKEELVAALTAAATPRA